MSILKKCSCEPEFKVTEISKNEKRVTFCNYISPVLPLSLPEQNPLTNIPSPSNSVPVETVAVCHGAVKVSGDVKSKVEKIITNNGAAKLTSRERRVKIPAKYLH